jgi:exonuclease SbcD
MVKDARLNYVALGHIHKAQDLNEGHQPPVVYPGSIERVDFGEAADDKYFVIAHVETGQPTRVEWRKLEGRRFMDRYVNLENGPDVMGQIYRCLPPPEELEGVILRLILDYPRELENRLEEAELRQYAAAAFEFHLVRRPRLDARLRLPGDQTVGSLTPLNLLDLYWKAIITNPAEAEDLQKLASVIIHSYNEPENPSDL